MENNRQFRSRALIMLALTLALGACASNPATGRPDFVIMSEEKEIEIGTLMHPKVLAEHRAYADPALQNYVNEIGQKLAKNSDRPGLTYTFTVIDSDNVNAFATPGGFIYLSRGLLAYLNSEAELAAVLGHEIAHITARHAVLQHSRGTMANIVGKVAGMAGGLGGSLAGSVLAKTYISGYGREHELDADKFGARYLVKSGYESQAMIDVVRVLKNQELFEVQRAKMEKREPKVYHGIFATHPDNDKRLREVVKEADKLDAAPSSVDNRDRFLARIDGLTFGRVDAGGVVTKEDYLHAGMGISMKLPEKWNVSQKGKRLELVAPSRQSIVLLNRQRRRGDLSPLQVMTDKIGLTNLKEGRSLSAAGVPGYTAIAPSSNSPYGMRPVRYAVFTDDLYTYVFAGASSDDRHKRLDDWRILNTIKSFRLLDESGLRSANIPTIAVISANEGTRLSTLAAASPLVDYPEEQLRLMNDLYPDGEPEVGQKIKIVD